MGLPTEQGELAFNGGMALCPNCQCSMRMQPLVDQARRERCPGCGRVRRDRPVAVTGWIWRCDNCKAYVTVEPLTLGQVTARGSLDASTD